MGRSGVKTANEKYAVSSPRAQHGQGKCFVLIDLKRGEVQHEDIGQMNFYLNYYREEMNTEGDTEPIGIVLGAYQDKLVMQYALQNISNQVFVSRYQLYLPNREQLDAEFRRYMGKQQSTD